MIQIKNLSKNFRTEEVETIALNGISMEVKKGEFIAIMGPSGCGKSTLLHILGLLDNPDEGSYLLEGEEVGHLKEKDRTRYRKGRIGFVFQSFNLIDELTVEENVDLQLKYLGIPKAERKQQRRDENGNCGDPDSCGILCGLAQGMGGLPYGKGGMDGGQCRRCKSQASE